MKSKEQLEYELKCEKEAEEISRQFHQFFKCRAIIPTYCVISVPAHRTDDEMQKLFSLTKPEYKLVVIKKQRRKRND